MKKTICFLMMAIGCWVMAEPAQAPKETKPGNKTEMAPDMNGRPSCPPHDELERMYGGKPGDRPPRERMEKPPLMPPKNPMLNARMQRVILLMSKMKKENPKEYARLDQLRKKNPRAFIDEVRKYLPKPKAMDRKHQILETECRELAAKIRAEKDTAEKEKMTKQLRAKLQEQFDLMLSDATERVNKIQQHMKLLKENEEFIVNERLEDMTK